MLSLTVRKRQHVPRCSISNVPSDIIARILSRDLIGNQDIANAALVNRAWLTEARRVIFRTVSFVFLDNALAGFAAAPHLHVYVRGLVIRFMHVFCDGDRVEQLAERCLTWIRDLSLSSLHVKLDSPIADGFAQRWIAPSSTMMRAVRTLWIEGRECSFAPGSSVERLTLVGTTWTRPGDVPVNLRRLSLERVIRLPIQVIAAAGNSITWLELFFEYFVSGQAGVFVMKESVVDGRSMVAPLQDWAWPTFAQLQVFIVLAAHPVVLQLEQIRGKLDRVQLSVCLLQANSLRALPCRLELKGPGVLTNDMAEALLDVRRGQVAEGDDTGWGEGPVQIEISRGCEVEQSALELLESEGVEIKGL